MRMLFSSVTAAGHLLPLVPLADAAADAGHGVAFLAGADMAGYLGSRALLPAGPRSRTVRAFRRAQLPVHAAPRSVSTGDLGSVSFTAEP